LSAFETLSEQRAFGGVQGTYRHQSLACGGPMRFTVFAPPAALRGERVPVMYCLAGLTATEETFATKAGAQRFATELELMLVTCDTSPRETRLPGDADAWDFGLGAGFYLDATVAPWSTVYQMRTYVAEELRALVEAQSPVESGARGVLGHSMGGHGALTLALSLPGLYRSVSAFAPIVAPSQVPWGQKAFSGYLGDDPAAWAAYDAVSLVQRHRFDGTIRIDQGNDDKFLTRELRPELFADACARVDQALELHLHPGYDHSYFFIMTFIEAQLRHHALAIRGR
jgi:S-formylglutathione hydrolase